MNKTYKVIYNRTRCMYQVVSELAKGHTKSETPEMLKSLFSKHSGLTRGIVMTVLSMSLAMPVGVAVQAEDTPANSETKNIATMKDGTVLKGDGAVSVSSTTDDTTSTTVTIAVPTDGKVEDNNTGLVTGGTVYTAVNAEQTAREAADKSLTDKIGTLDANGNYIQKDASVSSNLSTLDTQVKTNADAISKEKTDREAAVTGVTNTVNSLSDSAVKYDADSNKTKVTLAGEGGTMITNIKEGALSDSSMDAVTGKQLYAEQTARESADTTLTNKIGSLSANGNYIQTNASVSSNLSTLDTQMKTNADAISTETTNREKAVKDEAAARTTAINELETKLTSDGTNSLATKANVNASNIGKNIDTTDATTADEKKKKQEANATLWGEALGLGAIEKGDSMLISGGTLYSELRPSADGTYSYISNANTTAVNLIHLDAALNALGVEMLVDSNGNPVQYTSALYKYFKVNPETTNNDDGTKTYDTDAVANGTNSVAIGPNAKTAKYTTTTTSDDTTTTTETAADHAVAIGDGATVNAAGDQGVALGNGAVTGEAETTSTDGTSTTTTDAKGGASSVAVGDTAKANGNQAIAFGKGASVLNPSGTAVSTGSTAIGSGAKVDGGDNSIAFGTNATVNKVSDAMALGNGATINKTATGSIAIGKAAMTGGVDKPITLTNGTTGTLAAAGGVDSIAIGNGAVSEGDEALALGKGAKVTNGATGGDSAAAIVKTGSAAIGDGATVANSENSMAIGKGANITEGIDTTVIGSGAKASQTKQAFVAGYQASSDSSAESSVAIGDNASTHSARTTAIGYKAEAHNADSIAIGSGAKTDDNGGGIAIGTSTSAAYGGLAIGKSANALNDDSLAIGNGAVADVNKSISIGYNAGVGTAEDNKEKNGSLVAIGTSAGNNVKGMQNVAIGASAGSSVLSSNNIAIGTNAGYGIKNVTSTTDTNPQNGYNISIGAGANYTEGNTNQNIVSSIAIGHATHAVNRAVALGEGASAQGDSGMALGNSATSSGSGSIAIGNTASASKGNIALGAGAIATGTPTGTGKWTNTAAPSYYISVGGKGNASDSTITLRRISNVADGSADQDVVTVKQLQKVSDDLENTIKGIDTSQLKTYSATEIDNKIAEVNQNIKDSGVKYFSINSASQSTNSNNTGANGDGDADAMAIGPNAKASSVKALAIGNNVSASGTLSIAIGTANDPSTDTTTADNPHPTSSEGTSSVAIGTSAIAQTDNSIAIGTRATTYTANTTSSPVTKIGIQSIAIGYGAETRDNNAIAFGTGAKANSAASIAIGDNAQALNENAVVIGTSSTAYGTDSVTLGKNNTNNGKGVMTTGNSNSVTNSQSAADVVQNSGIYGSLNKIQSVSSSNSSNAITDVYAVGNSNKLNQVGEKNVLNDVSIMGNNNTIENGTAGAYTQTVKQIAVVGSGNTVKGNTDINTTTWGTVQRDTILGYNNTVDATKQSTPVSNLQILGNDVTATLGNSVYLGTGSSATASKSATAEAIQLAKDQGDAEAIASDEYKNATTEAEQTAIKQKYEAQHIHAANIVAMDKDGISAGIINYDTDYTYGNDSSYAYAGSNPTGVVTVGSKDATRRIQNVSAGLVGPNSTDAVNGSQLYALTRQIRFGGDNSTFGDAAANDVNVVAKGSNEKLAITGGAEGVSVTTTTDGKSVTTVDGTKITDKNIAVIAENDALHVKLASNLKNLNTASIGKTTTGTAEDGSTTTSYQETLKLDGTGDNGGTLALKDAKGENGVTLRTSGTTTTADVNGNGTTRLLVNNKTVATTDDGLKFGGDTGNDSALKLNNKLNIKGGADTTKLTDNNIGVVSDGNGTLTVKLNKNVNLGADGSLTTGTVTATTVTTGNSTLDNTGLTITGGPKFTSTGISANNQQIKNVKAGTDDTDAANYSQIKEATTTLTTGKNGNVNVTTNTTPTADGHTNYTIAVDNLAVKANGTGNTTVELAKGINFKDGANTTAAVGSDGTVTINATHNKLDSASYTASKPSDASNQTTVKLKDTDGNETTLNLTDTYTTVSKNTDHTITFKRNDGSDPVSVSLDDLNGASKEALTTAAAKATTTVIKGNNVDSVEDDTTSADGHHIYKVNVSNLGVKVADGQKKSVALSEGLVFGNGTNTTASVGDNGAITFNVSDAAIKTKAKDAINMTASSNVKVETATSTDGLSKTFTISATHNALKSATLTKGTNDVSTLTITGNDGDTASVDIKNTYLTVSKDSKAKTVTFTSNDGTTPATTLSLSDFGAASTTDMTAAVAKATTEVKAGTNATLGNLETDPTDQHKIYTVNVDNLGLKQNGTTAGNGTGVSLKNGLNFTDGTNTTASVKEDGTVSYSVSNDAIKAQAKDAVVVAAGDNVSIDTPTDANNVKTYTVRVNNLQLQADGVNKATRKLADGINFAGGTNTTADVTADGKVTYNLKDSISLNQVQTGDSTLNTNGLTITNGPIFTKNKIDANNQQITNVASGGDVATNAATIGDLNSAIQKASEGTTASGFKTKGNYGDAVTSRLDKQLNVLGDVDTTKVAEQNLSNGNVGVVTSTDNAGNATLTVKLNKDINLGEKGSVTTGNTVMNDAGITNGNMSLGANGLTIKDSGDTSKIKVAVTDSNVTMGGNVIHNVGAGTETTDAVNKGQLDALQKQVSGGWNLSGRNSDGTAVTAQIGAGETVTYNNGNYTKAVVTKDDSNNATVKVDVTTGTFGSNAGTVTSTTNGLATTGAVANAINSASWTIQDGNNIGNAQQVKAGDTVSLKAGDNLSLDQNGKEFTYKLNKTLQNMTSVTAVDDKQNTAVLNGEGLKVSDKEGDSLTQHATEVRLHSATAATEDTSKDVVLNNAGLTIGDNVKFTNNGISAGNQKITNVADGEVQTDSKEAVNGGQLYELQQKVTNGWKITGNDTTKAGNIGNDKTVSFVNGDNSYIKAKVYTTNTGATVSYTAQTASLMKNAEGKAALNGTTDGLVTGTNLTNVLNSLSWTAQSSKTGTGQNNGSTTAQSITAGTNVGFIAGDNMILTQDGTNFTYALNSNLTGMNTIAFTGLGNGASNLTIGLQDGGGANPDRGYYITGLSNTKWDQSNYEGSRAATEAQLREAIDKVSAATGTGGFGLTADEGANNGGEKKVSQTLGSTIAIQGDGTYDAEGKVVKQGNISTVAYTDNAGPTGAIKVKLNKDIDLSEAGSLTIGASKVSAGSIVLGNTSDAAKKIALNSTAGIASIGGVTVNGAEKTVNGLSNTKWTGKAVDGQAATENQLVEAINEAKKQAANSELHIRKGVYAIGKDSQGQDVTDTKGKNSVSIDVVNAKGAVDGQVVINDVAKASELGTVGELADNLKNPNGGPTTVVQAVNKVNQKVDDSLKQVNGDVTNAVTEAKKHTEVKSVDSDNNVTIDGTTTNADGGTVYKLGLNKDHLNLGNVHVYGNEGRVTAKTVESETVKIDDQTRLDKTGLTTGNTTVANNRIVVGGDNGIKMEANGGQQTISGLTNTDWTGTAVHGRAATEDQLAKAISSATTTAAQNEQHIKAGTYDIQTTTDDKGNKQNKVTMKIVDGTGKDKGTVTINDVAKASDVGDTDKLVADIKNRNGGQPQTTSVVEAVNNLNEKVNTRVGDNKYSAITSKDAVQDGDNSTTAIAKLNNRMTDIYHNATQHSSVAVDGNLTLDDKGINKSGGTEYKIGLNKDQINLGNLTIKGNEGSIEAKSIKSDSFTAGDTVVNKDGVKVGDKSALTGDSLKVNGKTYVDDKGVNANGQVIRNVGEGKDDGDAVNVKQVNDLAARQGESIDRNTAHINQLGQAVNKLGNRLNRVGAGAAALAALHPGTYDPNDKWDFSAGVGHYHDANAVAIGAYYHPNDTTILSIGGSMGGGENMVNAGITWKMGRSGREQAAQPVVVRKAEAAPVVQQAAQVRPAPVVVPVPAVTPAPVTTPAPVKSVAPATPVQAAPAVTTPMMPAAPSNDTAALAQILARQTAILEKLAQNQSQAAPSAAVAHGDDIFPDVPDNHWAYAYVAKLEKAGALKGFKRPAVLKSPMMTRDDFASVLYTAMANGATTNPALNGDDSLNRLAQEFKAELKNVKM